MVILVFLTFCNYHTGELAVIQATWEARTLGWLKMERLSPPGAGDEDSVAAS